jgi:hypothetical protein
VRVGDLDDTERTHGAMLTRNDDRMMSGQTDSSFVATAAQGLFSASRDCPTRPVATL